MRISILGNSGSGKSTFARWLASRTKLPLLHVDALQWLPEWKLRDEGELAKLLGAFEQRAEWIIDGFGPKPQLELRLKASSVILLIDTPPFQCVRNAQQRAADQQKSDNSHLAPGLFYRDVMDRQLQLIDAFEKNVMPQLRQRAGEEGWVIYRHFLEAYSDPRWSVPAAT